MSNFFPVTTCRPVWLFARFSRRGFRLSRVAFVALGIGLAVLPGCGKAKQSEDRVVAEMVIARGGIVTVQGTEVPAKTVAKLPKGEFVVARVDLTGKPVSDSDLEQIKTLTHLRQLNLAETHVTDAGLVHLKDLKELKDLSLYKTAISDRGVEQLQGLTQLTKLELSYTGVSDRGIEHLTKLKSLRTLFLYGTQVTKTGIDHLKKALPEAKIFH